MCIFLTTQRFRLTTVCSRTTRPPLRTQSTRHRTQPWSSPSSPLSARCSTGITRCSGTLSLKHYTCFALARVCGGMESRLGACVFVSVCVCLFMVEDPNVCFLILIGLVRNMLVCRCFLAVLFDADALDEELRFSNWLCVSICSLILFSVVFSFPVFLWVFHLLLCTKQQAKQKAKIKSYRWRTQHPA